MADEQARMCVYIMVHPPLLSLPVLTDSATRAASVKASFTPRFFMAEHSGRESVCEYEQRQVQENITQVTQGFDLLGDLESLVVLDHGLLGLRFAIVVFIAFPQITLERDQDEFDVGAVLGDFTDPFRFYVFQRIGGVDLIFYVSGWLVMVAERVRIR